MDGLGRITDITFESTDGQQAWHVGYRSNAQGQRTHMTYPDGTTHVTSTYGMDGRLHEVFMDDDETPLIHYAYDDNGRLVAEEQSWEGGVSGATTTMTTTYAYDGADRPTRCATSSLVPPVYAPFQWAKASLVQES